MSYIEKTEYYSVCPNCGAPRSGTDEACEFCGSSLIKGKQVVETSDDDPSEGFFPEDAALPVVAGQLYGTGGGLHWILSGGMFLLLPTLFFIVAVATGERLMKLFLGLLPFWAVGFYFIHFPICSMILKKKCAEQPEIRGTVRGYESGSTSINGHPVQNIRVKIAKNGCYELLLLKTMQTTRPYAVGSTIVLKSYKDRYILVK